MNVTVQPLALSVDAFCVVTGLGRTRAYELLNSGAVRSIKIGRKRLVLRESVEALLRDGLPAEAEAPKAANTAPPVEA